MCEDFLAGLREALGDDLVSVYLYGAVTFPRPDGWTLDVDFHTLLARAPADGPRDGLRRLHARLAAASDLGRELDGYHLRLADAGGSEPPRDVLGNVDDAWALHRAHVLAGRVAVLHGRHPRTILAPPSWAEALEALREELGYITEHPEHAAFGVLNACRIAWSLEHRDVVVSKWDAARWGASSRPGWSGALGAAVRSYTAAAEPADPTLLDDGRAAILREVGPALASAG